MSSSASELQKAMELHRAGQFAPAQRIYLQLLHLNPHHADALHLLGLSLLDTGEAARAVQLIEEAIGLEPGKAHYHLDLGLANKTLGKQADAQRSFERALQLRPGYLNAHLNLGISLMEQGQGMAAEVQFREALRLEPGSAFGWNNLANLHISRGDLEQARSCLEEAIRYAPAYAEAHNGLGSVWHRLGNLQLAMECFERALACRPNYATAHYNLGVALQEAGRLEQAIACFQRAVELRPNFVEAYFQWAVVLKKRQHYAEAEECLNRALELRADLVPALDLLAICQEYQGKTGAARTALSRALALQPIDELRIRSALLLPVIYHSTEQIRSVRHGLEAAVDVLAETPLRLSGAERQPGTPFFLAYQGLNDVAVMKQLARIYLKALPDLAYEAPHCQPGQREPLAGRRIRVGFLSRFFYRHTIAKLNLGLIHNLPREAFEVVLISLADRADDMSQRLEASADRTLRPSTNLDAARKQIAEQALDALIFTDVGMDPRTYFLACARLAPVQCVTWGHPVTSGIPTIDFFLSAEHLEPAGAEECYSEQLVRLPHLNTCYAEPATDSNRKTRGDFGLPAEAHLYLCTQSPYKLHPDMDQVFEAILQRDPDSVIGLLEGPQPHLRQLVQNRIQERLPHQLDRIRFLEQQSQADFVQLQMAADVLLDSFPFGGGNTSLEALAFGTPIVTLACPMLRGRITYACYRQMGINDCIANNLEEYVAIALQLGTDPAHRAKVSSRILERKHLLYNSRDAVDELAQFLSRAVNDSHHEKGRIA